MATRRYARCDAAGRARQSARSERSRRLSRWGWSLDLQLLELRGQRARRDAEEIGGLAAGSGAAESVGDLDSLHSLRRALGGLGQRSGEIDGVAQRVAGRT